MEIGLAKAITFLIAQRHRKYTVIPLILHAGHIEITANRIETEMIVGERPDPVLSQAVHVQSIIDQIGQVSERIPALTIHNVWCYACDSMSVRNYARGYFKASNHLVQLQIYHPNRWRLDLRCII